MVERTSHRKWDEFQNAKAKQRELEERAIALARPLCDDTHPFIEALKRVEADKAEGRSWTYAGLTTYMDGLAHLSSELHAVLDQIDDARAASDKAWRAWYATSNVEINEFRASMGVA